MAGDKSGSNRRRTCLGSHLAITYGARRRLISVRGLATCYLMTSYYDNIYLEQNQRMGRAGPTFSGRIFSEFLNFEAIHWPLLDLTRIGRQVWSATRRPRL
jgi:hypothetical protein